RHVDIGAPLVERGLFVQDERAEQSWVFECPEHVNQIEESRRALLPALEDHERRDTAAQTLFDLVKDIALRTEKVDRYPAFEVGRLDPEVIQKPVELFARERRRRSVH